MRPVYFLIGLVTWPVLRLVFRLRAYGLENLPEGGFVLAPGHISYLDPWVAGIPLWPRRQLRFMGKAELWSGILGRILEAGGAFPVRRGRGDLEAVETAAQLAREGEIVAIFPEGTRRSKGRRRRANPRPHTGAARVALAAGVPLVPAGIAGTDRLSQLGPLRVVYGRPLDLDDLGGMEPRSAAHAATDRVWAEIARLEAEAASR